MNKHYKYYFINGEIIITSMYSSFMYRTLHRVNGLAVEIYENNCLIGGWHYVYGNYAGVYGDNIEKINKIKTKILKRKVFE